MELDATNLPALCDTAIRDLAEVKTIGECLQIRDVMEAARVYARKHKMAQEAQDAVTKIVVLAERRIGQELIAAQQRGRLLGPTEGNTLKRRIADGDSLPATLGDIGLKTFEAQRFKHMADLDDADIEEVAAEARERGKPVAKADFKRKAQEKRQRNQPAPVIPPRPDHLNHFSLWLRNGARLVEQFADHREAMSLASRFGVFIDPEQVREIVEFLAALSAGLEADRAA